MKRIISISCVALIIVIGFAWMLPCYASTKALSVSASDALGWLKSKEGQAIDYDGVYGAQCVDLIKAYYSILGVPPQTGNGCDYATNTVPNGLTRIQNCSQAQLGDILVYAGGREYGHVAIYENDNTIWHQNWNGQYVRRISGQYFKTIKAYDNAAYWGVIRPDFSGGCNHNWVLDFLNSDHESSHNGHRVHQKCTSCGATRHIDEWQKLSGCGQCDSSGEIIQPPAPDEPKLEVYMAEWTDGTGANKTYPYGKYPNPASFFHLRDDKIRYIRVPNGLYVWVYTEENFNGRSHCFGPGEYNLEKYDGFDKSISSFKVRKEPTSDTSGEQYAIFYQGKDYYIQTAKLGVGTYHCMDEVNTIGQWVEGSIDLNNVDIYFYRDYWFKDGIMHAYNDGHDQPSTEPIKGAKSLIIVPRGGSLPNPLPTEPPKPPYVGTTEISIDKTELSLTKGETASLSARVAPDDASDKRVTWQSSDAAIASINDAMEIE